MGSWRTRPKKQRMICGRANLPIFSRLHNESSIGGRRGKGMAWQTTNEALAKQKSILEGTHIGSLYHTTFVARER